MAAQFEITKARIGHIEMMENRLKLVAYTSRKTAPNTQGEPQFTNDSYELVVFGQRAHAWNDLLTIGAKVQRLAGELRGAQMVAWDMELAPVDAAEDAGTASEASAEPAATEPVTAEPVKTRRRKVKAPLPVVSEETAF